MLEFWIDGRIKSSWRRMAVTGLVHGNALGFEALNSIFALNFAGPRLFKRLPGLPGFIFDASPFRSCTRYDFIALRGGQPQRPQFTGRG
jgi:hypothetical protein